MHPSSGPSSGAAGLNACECFWSGNVAAAEDGARTAALRTPKRDFQAVLTGIALVRWNRSNRFGQTIHGPLAGLKTLWHPECVAQTRLVSEPVLKMGGAGDPLRPAHPGSRYIGTDRHCGEQHCEKATRIDSDCRSRAVRRVAGRHGRVACATDEPFFKHALSSWKLLRSGLSTVFICLCEHR